jgi:hypothetical protein
MFMNIFFADGQGYATGYGFWFMIWIDLVWSCSLSKCDMVQDSDMNSTCISYTFTCIIFIQFAAPPKKNLCHWLSTIMSKFELSHLLLISWFRLKFASCNFTCLLPSWPAQAMRWQPACCPPACLDWCAGHFRLRMESSFFELHRPRIYHQQVLPGRCAQRLWCWGMILLT